MTTPGRVEIDTGALSAFTGDVQAAANDVAQAVDALTASIRKAQSGWQGSSNEAFQNACTSALTLLAQGREQLVKLGVTNLGQHLQDTEKVEVGTTEALTDIGGQLGRMSL